MSDGAFRKIFRLSDRLSVEITAGAGRLVCEWDPDVPGKLTPDELKSYHAARAEMLARLVEQ